MHTPGLFESVGDPVCWSFQLWVQGWETVQRLERRTSIILHEIHSLNAGERTTTIKLEITRSCNGESPYSVDCPLASLLCQMRV
jgi:hypothetical protein